MGSFSWSDVIGTIEAMWERFAGAVRSFSGIKDVIDILFVAVLVYYILKQFRRSQSIQVIKGLFLVAVLYLAVNLFEMNASAYLLRSVFSDILVILVVLFSSEIRQTLERVGNSRNISWKTLFSSGKTDEQKQYDTIDSVVRACANMSDKKIGSLIIFQRNSYLGDLTRRGVPVDSVINSAVIEGIFFPNAALHDGAIVINNNRVVAARCIIPLKNEKAVMEHVGTRHRAAIEISRTSDAVAVVTSEETGIISVALDGRLHRNLTDSELRNMLIKLLIESSPEERTRKVKSVFRRSKNAEKFEENENEKFEGAEYSARESNYSETNKADSDEKDGDSEDSVK